MEPLLGATCREAREALGLSVKETARRAELDSAHLLRFESGGRGMSSDNLARLFRVLGIVLATAPEADDASS